MLQSVLPNSPGTYVDIGSGHPVTGSNTYALYKLGWHGLLVDPIPRNIELTRQVRPRDKAITALCGATNQTNITFYEFEVCEYSTVLCERVQELKALGHTPKSHQSLEMFTLEHLLSQIELSGPTVLSLDVEGFELAVLSGNNWACFRPNFIVVEEWQPPVRKKTAVFDFLNERDYDFIAYSGASSLYFNSRS